MSDPTQAEPQGSVTYLGCCVYAHVDADGDVVLDLRAGTSTDHPANPICINREVLHNLVAYAARVWPEQEKKP